MRVQNVRLARSSSQKRLRVLRSARQIFIECAQFGLLSWLVRLEQRLAEAGQAVRREAVDGRGDDGAARPRAEARRDRESKERHRDHGSRDDCKRGREALRDVVGILHRRGYEEPANAVEKDDTPHHGVEALEHVVTCQEGTVLEQHRNAGEGSGEDAELDVPQPERGRRDSGRGGRLLQHHLKVHRRRR